MNGEPVDVQMKLEDTGEAFFIEEVECPDGMPTVPSYLATSPIPNDSLTYIGEALEKLKDDGEEEEDNFNSISSKETPVNLPPSDDPYDVNMNDPITSDSHFESDDPIQLEDKESDQIIESPASNKCLMYQVVCKFLSNSI